jgi:hypothetical protein
MSWLAKVLCSVTFCFGCLISAHTQQLFPNGNDFHRSIPFEFQQTVGAQTNFQMGLADEKKYVRFVYLVPADKIEKPEYKMSVANAARHLQLWYKTQLGNGKTFNIREPIVEVYKSSHDENWYSTNAGTDWAGEWKFWFNVVNDAFSLSGGSFQDPNNFWIIYVDALPLCPLQHGGGLNGVAAMGVNDLRGLIGQSWLPICNEVVPDYSPCRYVGGLGHELGHAFGLPHPPGCDDGQPVVCDYQSIMFTGYLDYPNTYFSPPEKAILNASPFITEVLVKECDINCASLTMQYTYTESIKISICEGETYFAGGASQKISGIYRDTFSSKLGCDSTVITSLTVAPKYQKVVEASICRGESYFAGGSLQSSSGTYRDIFSSTFGCDSVIVTKLTVVPQYDKAVEALICEGESYFAGGSLQTLSGTYRDIFSSAFGCDSVIVTKLTVVPKYEKAVEASICQGQSYLAGGKLQTSSGIYRDVYTSVTGCDSILVTNLTLISDYQKTVDVSICTGESYFAGGSQQTQAGKYTDIFLSILGCDSVVVINLKVMLPDQNTIMASICEGETYFAGGNFQSLPGIYYDTLQNIFGCDSVVVTQLVRGVCTGIEATTAGTIKVYPVPTRKFLYVEVDRLYHADLFNTAGQHILTTTSDYIDFTGLASGYYYLRIYYSKDEFVGRNIIFSP